MNTFKAVAAFTDFEARASGTLVGRMVTLDHCESRLTLGFPVGVAAPKAREIGTARLAQVCKAIGVMSFSDTDELLGKPFLVEYRKDLATTVFYVVAVKPLVWVQTRIEYRDKPSFWVRLKGRFTAWRNGYREPEDFGDDWGYDNY